MARKGNHARRSGPPMASKLILLACVVLVLIVAGSALFGGDNSPVSDTAPPVTEPGVPANGQSTQSPDVDSTAGAEPTSAPSETPAQPSAVPSAAPSSNPGGLQERASDIGRSIAVPESAAVDDNMLLSELAEASREVRFTMEEASGMYEEENTMNLADIEREFEELLSEESSGQGEEIEKAVWING